MIQSPFNTVVSSQYNYLTIHISTLARIDQAFNFLSSHSFYSYRIRFKGQTKHILLQECTDRQCKKIFQEIDTQILWTDKLGRFAVKKSVEILSLNQDMNFYSLKYRLYHNHCHQVLGNIAHIISSEAMQLSTYSMLFFQFLFHKKRKKKKIAK